MAADHPTPPPTPDERRFDGISHGYAPDGRLAFGAILVLAPRVGPLLATLIVVSVLVIIAGAAAWRAHIGYGDIRTALRRDLTGEGFDDAADT